VPHSPGPCPVDAKNQIAARFGLEKEDIGRSVGPRVRSLTALKQVDKLPEAGQRKVYNNIGTLYLNMGRYGEARKYLTIAAEKYDSKQAREDLDLLGKMAKKGD
jgi:Flp pilus assembly protein TadD